MSTRNLTTTTHEGSTICEEFDDQVGIPDLNIASIQRILVTHNQFVRSLTVHYNNREGVMRGSTAGKASDVCLTPGEWITEIEGTFGNGVLSKLSFVTSKGRRWGPYGNVSLPTTFHWNQFGPHMGLLYFAGRSDKFIRGLQATFATYTNVVTPSSLVKYEQKINAAPDTQSPAPISKFTRLMAPTVTLFIGPDLVVFHVSHVLLCTLPFFRAALQGEFREAIEQEIKMPSDQPEHVSAMIEYLYTDSYTYAYSRQPDVESVAPPADLAEGSFHVGVYATAFKYDCQALVKASLESFVAVLTRLRGVDVIRLWRVAYDQELHLSAVEEHTNLVEFRKGLGALLKGLYVTDRREMGRTAEEHPSLVDDLLRLVVSG